MCCLLTCKYGAGLRSLVAVGVGQREELVDVVGLEEAPLLGVLQDTVGQKLFEDLPERNQQQKRSHYIPSTSGVLLLERKKREL